MHSDHTEDVRKQVKERSKYEGAGRDEVWGGGLHRLVTNERARLHRIRVTRLIQAVAAAAFHVRREDDKTPSKTMPDRTHDSTMRRLVCEERRRGM